MRAKDNILTQFDTRQDDLQVNMGEILARLFPFVDDSCQLTMVCRREDYSASLVARAVEDCDAHLLNLNVTGDITDAGEMIVELRVGINNGESVARSLARYGYEVVNIKKETSIDDNTMQQRIGELLHYIEL